MSYNQSWIHLYIYIHIISYHTIPYHIISYHIYIYTVYVQIYCTYVYSYYISYPHDITNWAPESWGPMIWITVPAGPFLSHKKWKQIRWFFWKKNVILWKQKYLLKKMGYWIASEKEGSRVSSNKKIKRLQKNEHFVCGRLQIWPRPNDKMWCPGGFGNPMESTVKNPMTCLSWKSHDLWHLPALENVRGEFNIVYIWQRMILASRVVCPTISRQHKATHEMMKLNAQNKICQDLADSWSAQLPQLRLLCLQSNYLHILEHDGNIVKVGCL